MDRNIPEQCTDKIRVNTGYSITRGNDSEFVMHLKKLGRVESLKQTIDDVIAEVNSNGFLKENSVIMTADKENGYRVAIGRKVKEPAYSGEFMRPILMLSLYHEGQDNISVSMTHCLGDGSKLTQSFDISTDKQCERANGSLINYLKHGCGRKIFSEYHQVLPQKG